MKFALTTATRKIAKLDKRYRAIQGGTSASKTISILLVLIAECQGDDTPKLVSVVSESMPHLKRGAMRDFLNIMQNHGYYVDARWNKSDFIYTFETGSRMEFFSADSADKVRGPRRDKLFLNECNNITFEAFNQLEVRTRETVWLDWNPTQEFWFYTEILTNEEMMKKLDYMTITYLDNEALEPAIVASIEARKPNKSWWTVYGLGQLGEVEGRIYRGWRQVDEIPHEARLERRGLDFGYSVDPAVMVDIYYYNGGYIIDEGFYQVEMKNRQIADWVKNQPDPKVLICADSAEPKSIAELQEYGINVVPVAKGRGSVNHGIQWVQSQQISYTKRSLNIRKAYNNYMWKTDKDGNILDVPDHYLSDAMDAVRYGFESLRPVIEEESDVYEPDITSLFVN